MKILFLSVALGREELNEKQEKLKKLAKDCANIESVEIKPEVKKEIMYRFYYIHNAIIFFLSFQCRLYSGNQEPSQETAGN